MKNYLGLLGAVALTLAACSPPKDMTVQEAVSRTETNRWLWSCHQQNILPRPEFDAAQNMYPTSTWRATDAVRDAAKKQARPMRASVADCRNIKAGAQQSMAESAARKAQQSANIRARLNSGPTTCFQPMPGTTITCF